MLSALGLWERGWGDGILFRVFTFCDVPNTYGICAYTQSDNKNGYREVDIAFHYFMFPICLLVSDIDIGSVETRIGLQRHLLPFTLYPYNTFSRYLIISNVIIRNFFFL